MNTFNVIKRKGEMISIPDKNGNYRAESGIEIERALTELDFIPLTAEVRLKEKWYPLKAQYTQEIIPSSPLDILFVGKTPRKRIGGQ